MDNSKIIKRLKNNIEGLFEVNDLSKKWKKLERLLRGGIYCKLKNSNKEILVGDSKIGGLPDLPKNQEWFNNREKPLSFLAQINFSEVKKFDTENKLPDNGIIYFFYDAEEEPSGYSLDDKNSFKVFYFEGNLDILERKNPPNNLNEEFVFPEVKLTFKSELDLPNYESKELSNILNSDKERDTYIEIQEELSSEYYALHKILGHSDNIQGQMETVCEIISNNKSISDLENYINPDLIKQSKKMDITFSN